MGIDIRYHIISLIAVFLALGIGILVGSTLVPRSLILEKLVDKQNAIVKGLEEDFKKIREENRELRKELDINYQFQREILPLLIKNKLQNIKLSIIETNPTISNFVKETLSNVLVQTGAELLSTTVINNSFLLTDENIKNEIINYLGIENPTGIKREDIITLLVKEIAEEMVNVTNLETLQYLNNKKLLKMSGNYTSKVDYIILIGGAQEISQVRYIDIPLIKKFLELNQKVIGCEPKEVAISCISNYKKVGIPTVDNIDTIAGQVALIYVLQGYEGHFGIKPTSTQLLPRILE